MTGSDRDVEIDLDDLYQQVIVDHSRSPRNFRELTDATASGEGHNPLCGDRITVYLRIDDSAVVDISFLGRGCAICIASASMMTESVKGRSVRDVEAMFNHFHAMLTDAEGDVRDDEALDKLVVFEGVSRFPVRVKCATLPWHTMKAALGGRSQVTTTEGPP